jgi:polyhydroxyalkanoate synthase
MTQHAASGTAATGPAHRLGPRPLPLHLTAAALAWTSSLAALPLLRQGSPLWKAETARPSHAETAAQLRQSLAASDPEAFAEALGREARARAMALLDGILAYRRHPYRRNLPPAACVWAEGSTRLLDYGAIGGQDADGHDADGSVPVLVVPSLVNRAYILDLDAETSLLRWLAGHGLRPYPVDWDRPGAAERGFTLTDYIAGRLEGALDAVRARHRTRPLVIGYCMGGNLALALALRRHDDIAGLALMATPWDFHAEADRSAALAVAAAAALSPSMDALGEMTIDAIQSLFASLDPLLVARKFINFAHLDPAGRKAVLFVALEDWLNDGVPLTAPVARECLIGWYGENTPARGHWRVAGRPVDPGALKMPSLCLIPAKDRIVPPASAAALGAAIPGAEVLQPPIGHIGMVVSGGAKERIWSPLAEWLLAHSKDHAPPRRRAGAKKVKKT